VRRIVHEAHERASDLLTRYREQLDRIAQRLIEVETLDADEFAAVFEGVSDKEPETPESSPPMPGVERSAARPAPERRAPTLDMPPAPAPA
jgi:cell division protease FtsH